MKHYLIDYENIQPENFNQLHPKNCHIWLFIGQKQSTLPVSFMQAQAKFGNSFHIIQTPKTGKNALDFILAAHVGQIVKDYPQSEIIIVSKDKGFDVLIAYYRLQSNIKSIQRTKNLQCIQITGIQENKKKRIPILEYLEHLLFPKIQKCYQKLPKRNIPKNEKSLHNFIYNIVYRDLQGFDDTHKQTVCQQLATYLV